MLRIVLTWMLWLALLAWAATILFISSLTPESLPRAAFVTWDKLNHLAAFAAGGWLAASALRSTWPERPVRGLLVSAVLLVALFGAFDEALQTFTPGRSGGDIFDWIADLLGAMLGTLLNLLTHARLQRLVTRR